MGVVVCFLFLICGACRLARFNISVNPQPRNPGRPGRKYFVGMPIPAGAGVIASVIHFQLGSWIADTRIAIVWLLLIAPFTPRKRALHDIAACVVVVRNRALTHRAGSLNMGFGTVH